CPRLPDLKQGTSLILFAQRVLFPSRFLIFTWTLKLTDPWLRALLALSGNLVDKRKRAEEIRGAYHQGDEGPQFLFPEALLTTTSILPTEIVKPLCDDCTAFLGFGCSLQSCAQQEIGKECWHRLYYCLVHAGSLS